MDVDVRDFHRRGLEWFGANVRIIGEDQWRLPTPCTEWDVRALVSHLVYETRWVPPLLEGRTIQEVGDSFEGDLLGDDPKGAWEESATEALAAVEEEGALERITHLSYGDRSAGDYIFELSTDLVIHGWDLARAIGADEKLDRELVELIDGHYRPNIRRLKATGLFGPDVTPPPGADRQTELLAMFGREA
jgi:uncharacterized protein (TIGR03086 family)